jgi:predicted permease
MMIYAARILEIVFPVIAIAALGFCWGIWKKLDAKVLADVVLFLLAPAVIFDALVRQTIDTNQLLQTMGISLAIHIIPGAIAWAISLLAGIKQRIFVPGVLIMNAVSLPYPLALLAFGEEGLSQVVLLSIPNIFITFTIGIYFHGGKSRSADAFRMPALWAAIVGLALAVAAIPVPKFFLRFTHLMGRGMFPIELFTLGYRLRSIRISDIRFSCLVASLRIGLGFATAVIISNFLALEGAMRAAVFLVSCSPPAVVNYIFAERYGADGSLAASVVFTGILISVVTTPLVLLYLELT